MGNPTSLHRSSQCSCACRLVVKRLGLDAAREAAQKKVMDVKFEPKETSLSKPKFGKEDPNNAPHTGGNTWAGGVRSVHTSWVVTTHTHSFTVLQTGGRDTAGMGGRGGYMRLYKGHNINQVLSSMAMTSEMPIHI